MSDFVRVTKFNLRYIRIDRIFNIKFIENLIPFMRFRITHLWRKSEYACVIAFYNNKSWFVNT
jgi:hypothetical protein